MSLSISNSLWHHRHPCWAGEGICRAEPADINTIVILGTRILFSSILYLLHWTLLTFLLPELGSETKSSAGALNRSLDDCLFLFLVSFYLWSRFSIEDFQFWWSDPCYSSLQKFLQVSEACLTILVHVSSVSDWAAACGRCCPEESCRTTWKNLMVWEREEEKEISLTPLQRKKNHA